MKIFTKRNALVGYLALRTHSHARRHYLRRQKKRSGLKLVTLLVLGILSVGLLLAFAGVLHRRSRETDDVEDAGADTVDEVETVVDAVDGSTEPIPAT